MLIREFESRRGEILNLFERSEFLIDTCQKKTNACVCSSACLTNLGFSVGYATNLGFSVGYVLSLIHI